MATGNIKFHHNILSKEISFTQCLSAIKNKDFKMDSVIFTINLIIGTVWAVLEFIYENILVICLVVLMYYLMKVFYVAYIDPILIKKELTDIGFEHIPFGPDRDLHIARTQATRRKSNKIPPPYPNGWYALVESRDLKIGGVTPVDALGQNLCVYRGTDGTARCVDAYCPHLGANLAVGGNVCGNCIECPFHQWRFNEDGTCVSVPGVEHAPKGVSIKTWTTVEADGAVWVWFDAEGREPLWGMEEPAELREWGYRGRNEYIVAAHIQEIPENAADPAHLNVVHSTSLLSSLGEKYPFLQNIIGNHEWRGEWVRGEGHTAAMTLSHDYNICKRSVWHFDVSVTQLGPSHVRLLMRSVLGPVYISQSVTPLGPLLQRVVHRMFSPPRSAIFATIVVKAEADMFERDVKVWNSKVFVSAPTYVKTDKTIRSFRSWYSQFYSENSVTYRDAVQNTLDW